MVDKKAVIEKVITALVTTAILGVFAYLMGVFEKGNEALSKDQIRTVINEVLVTDSGLTHAAALNKISLTQAQILTRIGEVKEDVNDLEDAVLQLASE